MFSNIEKGLRTNVLRGNENDRRSRYDSHANNNINDESMYNNTMNTMLSGMSRGKSSDISKLTMNDLLKLQKQRDQNHKSLTNLETTLLRSIFPSPFNSNNSDLNSNKSNLTHSTEIEKPLNNSTIKSSAFENYKNNFEYLRGLRARSSSKNKNDEYKNYEINADSNPIVITKRPTRKVEYTQSLAVRYLKPPTPEPPGDLVIKMEAPSRLPPPPPLILRQIPKNLPRTPSPIVYREEPPAPPPKVDKKVITIKTKQPPPPPPRKIIIERVVDPVPKPPTIIIERWLPYSQPKRKVIYEKLKPGETKPNVTIYSSLAEFKLKENIADIQIVDSNPADYYEKYGSKLIDTRNLPPVASCLELPTMSYDSTSKSKYETIFNESLGVSKPTSISHHETNVVKSKHESLLKSTSRQGQSSVDKTLKENNPSPYSTINKILESYKKASNEKLTVEETLRLLFEIKRILGSKTTDEYLDSIFERLRLMLQSNINADEFKRIFRNYLD